ncbi:MAG: hypothetical protein WAR59_00900 [Ignavibacteriaceae bacterium]
MKYFRLISFSVFLLIIFLLVACNNDNPTSIKADKDLKLEIIPDEEVIFDWNSNIYQHDTNLSISQDTTVYDSIASFLKSANLDIEDMWCPNEDMVCRIPLIIGQEIIVKLSKADANILKYNFQQNTGSFPFSCFNTWSHYKYSTK